jgi:hypothetical protein
MDENGKRAFLFLLASQALHSIEEYYFALWEVLAPARFLSGLVSSDLAVGFAVINAAIVAFGVWTYLVPVQRNLGYALPLAWFWTLLETGNGIGHIAFAAASQGYFPGVYTAPLLLASAGYLAMQLLRAGGDRPAEEPALRAIKRLSPAGRAPTKRWSSTPRGFARSAAPAATRRGRGSAFPAGSPSCGGR